jgi:hypothetical protein
MFTNPDAVVVVEDILAEKILAVVAQSLAVRIPAADEEHMLVEETRQKIFVAAAFSVVEVASDTFEARIVAVEATDLPLTPSDQRGEHFATLVAFEHYFQPQVPPESSSSPASRDLQAQKAAPN